MERILVIQTAFLGDAILATSLIESLNAAYPTAVLDVLVRKDADRLFDEHPFVRKVYSWNKKQQKYAGLRHILKQVRAARYDLVVNAHRFGSSGLLTAFSGARIKVGFKKNPWSFMFTHAVEHAFDGAHEIERNHALLMAFDKNIELKPPKLYPFQSANSSIPKGAYVCIAPTSVWFTKQWPAHQWIDLIKALPSSVTVHLLGAETDKEACENIRQKCGKPNVENLAGTLDLLDSAALMSKARMNFVNDSAPLHIASAVNAPVTVVYCSTVPKFGFGPLSAQSHIIETAEALDCRPCGLHGHARCPKGHFNCAEHISISSVLDGAQL